MADAEEKPTAAAAAAATTEPLEPAASEDRPAIDPKKPLTAIKVFAPFKIYYEGEGYSVTAVNETGQFDILPHHHNFITMLVPCDLVIKTPYEEKTVRISRALMHVKADKVTVYVDV